MYIKTNKDDPYLIVWCNHFEFILEMRKNQRTPLETFTINPKKISFRQPINISTYLYHFDL